MQLSYLGTAETKLLQKYFSLISNDYLESYHLNYLFFQYLKASLEFLKRLFYCFSWSFLMLNALS